MKSYMKPDPRGESARREGDRGLGDRLAASTFVCIWYVIFHCNTMLQVSSLGILLIWPSITG